MIPAALHDDRLASLAGETLALVAPHNPLAMSPRDAADLLPAGAPRVVAWSGSLGESLFDRSFATWMPAGREALARYLDAALDRCRETGTTLLLRTHARHVLSDAVAARALLEERDDPRLAIAFDPAACFEAEMLPDAEDHLTRLFELAAPLADLVILRSLAPPARHDDPPAPAPLGEGLLNAESLARLARDHARDDAIVAAVAPNAGPQLAAAGFA